MSQSYCEAHVVSTGRRASIRAEENDDRQVACPISLWRDFMRIVFSVALIFSLIISAVGVATAQSTGRKRAPASTTGAVKTSARPKAPSPAATDELLSLLPASASSAGAAAGRASQELLPHRACRPVAGVDKRAKSIQHFPLKTGIEPSKIQNVVLSFSMAGPQGTGVNVIKGIDPDPQQIEA